MANAPLGRLVKRYVVEKRQVDWTFDLSMFSLFCILQFQQYSGYKVHVLSSFCDRAKDMEKHQADRPFEIQWLPKWRPKSIKWQCGN